MSGFFFYRTTLPLLKRLCGLKSGLRALHRVYLRGLAKVITTREIAPSSASSLSDQQQTVVSDADNPGIDATDTPLLRPLPENEPHPPFWKLMPYYEFDKPAQRKRKPVFPGIKTRADTDRPAAGRMVLPPAVPRRL
ncbi:hypothetical protein ACLB1E_33535 [Escherichia coli]